MPDLSVTNERMIATMGVCCSLLYKYQMTTNERVYNLVECYFYKTIQYPVQMYFSIDARIEKRSEIELDYITKGRDGRKRRVRFPSFFGLDHFSFGYGLRHWFDHGDWLIGDEHRF